MSIDRIVNILDCGCAIYSSGRRVTCPSCLDPAPRKVGLFLWKDHSTDLEVLRAAGIPTYNGEVQTTIMAGDLAYAVVKVADVVAALRKVAR